MPAGSALLRLATATAVTAASAISAVAFAAPAGATSSDAYAYLARINAERAAHGLHALTMRSDLNRVAQGWANHMASVGVLSHNPRLASQVTNWQVVGENVGEGPTIAALDSAFWASAPHRANILDRTYRDVGVATAVRDGIIWITIDFRDPEHAESSSTVAKPRVTRTTTPVHRTLREGSRGRDVAAVQRKVHVAADGVFGPKTRRAVIRFQRSHHLHANGVVGPATWKALHL
jgi:hypothetical protein